MAGYWNSPEGALNKLLHRRMSRLIWSTDLEPPSKRARPAKRRRATEQIDEIFNTDLVLSYARSRARWPKPRAPIALDVWLSNATRNSPRIDSICKWLLDELEGRVYQDDRQVKLLFARADRDEPPWDRLSDDSTSEPWGSALNTAAFEPASTSPRLHVTARPRSDARYITCCF